MGFPLKLSAMPTSEITLQRIKGLSKRTLHGSATLA
jgi:hypothetical protein